MFVFSALYANDVLKKNFKLDFNNLGPIAMEFSEEDIEPLKQTKYIFSKYLSELKFGNEVMDNLTQVYIYFYLQCYTLFL